MVLKRGGKKQFLPTASGNHIAYDASGDEIEHHFVAFSNEDSYGITVAACSTDGINLSRNLYNDVVSSFIPTC